MKGKMIINKKAWVENLFFAIVISMLLFLIGLLCYESLVHGPMLKEIRKEACESIGFEKYVERQDMDFCEDKQGNLYYIKIDCEQGLYFKLLEKCEIKQIKVGEVFGI